MKVKILSREEAVTVRNALKAEGKRVGFTSGVFDILHPGHVGYLEEARALVDVLFVGINSDASVKLNKGGFRPVNSERERAEVVSGLSSVDHIFIFSERNNNLNVEALKPDLYIKAGDYSEDKLSSKQLVESYGGRVALVPFREGSSTTGVIEKIQAALLSDEGEVLRREVRPAVFLDRDGTINEHVEYLSDPKGFVAMPGAFAAIKKFQDLGYRVVVVTNQPGIGLGYFSKEDLYAVNREMLRQASQEGCAFDKLYFCPHSKSDNCSCRKPGPYFLQRAERELNLDLANSFMIGDMTSDVQCGINAGIRTILVQTGRGGSDKIYNVTASYTARDLLDAAAWIATQPKQSPSTPVASPTSSWPDQPVTHAAASLAGGLHRDYSAVFGSILASADLIEQRVGGDNRGSLVADSVGLIRKAAHRGIAASKKLEVFATLSDAPRAKRSLRSCVESVIELVSSAHGKECSLELVCPHDVEVEVADFAVVQMLLELCENSLEAMQALPERFIVFHVDVVSVAREAKDLDLAPGSYARVSIVDHGDRGDTAEVDTAVKSLSTAQAKEFDRGLGLSMLMVRSVMKQHGGTIAVASRRQTGTNISLYFPLP